MSLLQYPTLQSLATDLHHINLQEVQGIVDTIGWDAAMKSFGFRLDSYDYHLLAGRMLIASHRLKCPQTIEGYVELMKRRLNSPVMNYLLKHAGVFNELIHSKIIVGHDWFSANSLVGNYLACNKYGSDPVELPEIFCLRIACQAYHEEGDLDKTIVHYNELVDGDYSVASPIAYNSGMVHHQMSSCFLYQIGDNIDSFTDSWSKLAHISKHNGGNGFDMSKIRHSEIGDVGMSSGVIPLIQVLNSIVKAINQTGKRKGAATAYLRPHHIDVFSFCELSLKTGDHNLRAYDINTALWCSDLFFDRVKQDREWTLFCPAYTPELNSTYGVEFNRLYELAESRDMPTYAKVTVGARKLLTHIANCQIGSSMPYILHADAANFKSNQRHRGYIPCSNLCLEIIEYSDEEETASCNLSSISLRAIVEGGEINYNKLARVSRSLVRNLNRVIDNNWSPIESITSSNKLHRPLGIGVSGLYDMLQELNLSFEDREVVDINKRIFACIYFNSMLESIQEAIRDGPYESFLGSPLSEGKFQFDLWADELAIRESPSRVRVEADDKPIDPILFDQERVVLSNGSIVEPTWNSLRETVLKYGVRNSLLVALMPTATSSQILRNCETVEAHMSNIYSRKVISGAYTVLNRYLVRDLEALRLWNRNVIEHIQGASGSVAGLVEFVQNNYPKFNGYEVLSRIVVKYKTMWELKQMLFLKLAADRARYICQSQSTNLYIADATPDNLKSIHLYTNALGLKTGMYYLRQRPSSQPLNFTLSGKKVEGTPTCDDNSCCSS